MIRNNSLNQQEFTENQQSLRHSSKQPFLIKKSKKLNFERQIDEVAQEDGIVELGDSLEFLADKENLKPIKNANFILKNLKNRSRENSIPLNQT